jgi:hypothetical protein
MMQPGGKMDISDYLRDLPMEEIPRWAVVALAARTARRVQPLFLASWPTVLIAYQQALEWAISEAELAASQGCITPDLKKAGEAVGRICGIRPQETTVVYYTLTTASGATSLACSLKPSSGIESVLSQALYSVYYFERESKTNDVLPAFISELRTDFERLRKASAQGNWDEHTPVSPDFFGPLWPNGSPEKWPHHTLVSPRPRAKSPSLPKMEELGLPQELVDFFKAGRQLDFDPTGTEIGPIRLKPFDHLRIDWFPVNTDDTPEHENDPHRFDEGAYQLRIVDLVGEDEVHGPDGLLAWFCDYHAFGCCNHQNGVAMIFPNTTWSDIVADPAKHLDAPWNWIEDCQLIEYLKPWEHCEFKSE